jgi:hypothetical protein
MIVVCVRVSNTTSCTYGLTVGKHYEVIDSSDSNSLGLINDFKVKSYYDTFIDPMYNEITDDTGKVISLAEVSDYNIIYVGGLTPNLTYGKSYFTLKLRKYDVVYAMSGLVICCFPSSYFYIINDVGDVVGKRKSDNLFIEITKIREEKINSLFE